jgi:phosphoribosyl-AMP cyclohydrolase
MEANTTNDRWLEEVHWSQDGLVPAIAQEAGSAKVLMVAWMNREALKETAESGQAVYWSRSRKRLWRKGEESGHVQKVRSIRLDCDEDVILLEVEQVGGIACHTGRANCFFRRLEGEEWMVTDPVLKNPEHIYAVRGGESKGGEPKGGEPAARPGAGSE